MENSYNEMQNKITRECIFSALMILMKNKQYKEISITEITHKAGVSRMAYYRNFSSKDDIIISHLDTLFEEYTNQIKSTADISEKLQCTLFFCFFREHKEFIENIVKAKLFYLLLQQFDNYTDNMLKNFSSIKSNTEKKHYYITQFMSGGLFKILIAWIDDGLQESDEYMADIVLDLYQ